VLCLAFLRLLSARAWPSYPWRERRLHPGTLRLVVLAGMVAASVAACGTNLVLDFGDGGVGGAAAGAGGSLGGTSGLAGMSGSGGAGEAGQGGSAGSVASSGAGGMGTPVMDAGAPLDAGDAAADASN